MGVTDCWRGGRSGRLLSLFVQSHLPVGGRERGRGLATKQHLFSCPCYKCITNTHVCMYIITKAVPHDTIEHHFKMLPYITLYIISL